MDQQLALCIDLGGTFIKGALVDRNGHILKKDKEATGAGGGREAVSANIINLAKRLAAEAGQRPIIGIGCGVPGSVDTETATIVAGIENVPELNGVSLAQVFASDFPCPVFLDNDATNAAKGEFLFGAGRGFRNLACLTLGTGIGAGLILDGRVYHGTSDYAGELGHMIVVPEGRRCSCGNFGCLEAYASGTAMVKKAKARRKKGVASRLLEYRDEEITPRLIEDLSDAGDRQCTEILQEAGRCLGIGLASLVNLLNLERVVIGGGISAAGPVLFDPIETNFRAYVLPQAGRRCEIVKAALGNDAGIMGGAATVFMSREELSS